MARKPVLLDLFCGAGGCATGYHRAGFDVVGVDVKPQPRYPFPFLQQEALWIMDVLQGKGSIFPNDGKRYWLKDFAAIHASPPCQAYSRSRNNGQHKPSPMLIPETRRLLEKTSVPWIIENVEGAPLRFAVVVCGASFGLGVDGFDLSRHRLFESNHMLLVPPCEHRRGRTIGVYGNGTNSWHRKKFGRNMSDRDKKKAMGIDWMTRAELTQAIPPAYCEYLGKQLIRMILDSSGV